MKKIFEWVNAKLNIRSVRCSLPSFEESAIIAVKLSDECNHSEQEQAMFIAGFVEGIKYIKQGGNDA